jgi:hypothetical protein
LISNPNFQIPEDLAAAKRIFKGMNRAENFTHLVNQESPRLFELIKDTVHAFKAKKEEAFKQFLPETNEFITKVCGIFPFKSVPFQLQAILENAIEETAALYKLEKPEVKENLRTIFPKAMFIIERELIVFAKS